MTVWDSIYQDYQNGGEAWATLREDLDPFFVKFVQTTKFVHKSALDIGCGTGNYLAYLSAQNFKVAGIDNSPTAIRMTEKSLGEKANLSVEDMYSFDIPATYDFIFSLSTIHHGQKSQVEKVIKQIYEKLLPRGSILITLPDLKSSKLWESFKDNEQIEPGTFTPLSGPEKGLEHSFFTKEEIENIFSIFSNLKLILSEDGRWYITGTK